VVKVTLKIVFMGTPAFGVPALRVIIKNYNVEAVFTQPDKPKGRGQRLQYTPVKEVALENNIVVYQPQRLRGDVGIINIIKEINPDIIIVIAYGQILPRDVLQIPRLGCINLHASLLPKLRGAAPINWSIINGDTETGNTTMIMADGIDTGDMLLKSKITIGENETYEELYDRLSQNGVKLLMETIEGLKNNTLTPQKQDDMISSYASMMKKELGHINWDNSCERIHGLIRGVTPWPGAYTFYGDKTIKLNKVEKNLNKKRYENVGEILEVSKNGIEVSCREGSIIIKELQEVGGKRLDAAAYLNGHNVKIGDKLT
jgi:methionyl-tRNA formyltransferase